MRPDDDPVIHGLCLRQLAPWLGAPIARAVAEEVYHRLNATVRSIFLLRIEAGGISLLDKPGFTLRSTFNDSREPEPDGPVIYREEFIRAHMYREFFQRCLAASGRALNSLIAIDVNDAPIANAEAPVFAFQKPDGGNTVLMPDVDFLHWNFYIPPEFQDKIAYEEKAARAVFAGSTTGGRTISVEDVLNLSIPRLRSGVFFQGCDQVDFRIPRIVQCETALVAEMVAALGIDKRHCSWPEQFAHRFILSMDGNGATCSRVVIGMLSKAALVKYQSEFQLYYFGGLVPWQHFVPVSNDTDVIAVVEAERRHPMMFASVAAEGARFARRYLGREGVCGYMAELLSLYPYCFSDGTAEAIVADEPVPQKAAASPLVEFGAHVQGVGDVWGWPGEWVGRHGSGQAIEAIAMVPAALPAAAINCRVLLDDGSFATAAPGEYFHGTRGQNRPIHGFELQLCDAWSRSLDCTYRGSFLDGETIGPLSPGQICKSPTGAALEAFDVSITEKAG